MGNVRRLSKVLRNSPHSFPGHCNVCARGTIFVCTDSGSLRENLFCPWCRSFSRKRHVVRAFLRELGTFKSLKEVKRLQKDAYSASATDQLWRRLGSDPRFHGSDLYPDLPPGTALPQGGTCQNLEELTFDDDAFDIVLTEDVLEHVRYPDRAFAEIARVLRPGGVHIFTVPMFFDIPTLERVEPREDGPDVMLTEPEWHGDNVHGRALAYRTFGVDLDERLEAHGFRTEVRHATGEMRKGGIVESYVLESRLNR